MGARAATANRDLERETVPKMKSVVTIQKTSKGLKAQLILSRCLLYGAFVLIFFVPVESQGDYLGASICGMVWLAGVKVSIWWSHV